MVQGTLRTKPRKPSKLCKPSHPSKNGITKKGTRIVTPKKTSLMRQQKMTKKFSAGLTAKTEKMLGEKVGHLEMLGGARKKQKSGEGKAGKKQSMTKGQMVEEKS